MGRKQTCSSAFVDVESEVIQPDLEEASGSPPKLVLSLISNFLLLSTPPKTETYVCFRFLSDQSCFGPLSLLLSDF